MAAGPIYPTSVYPADTTGRLFPNFYAGSGGNASTHDEGLGVMASLSADAVWELRFPIPPTIPTGTMKLRTLTLANASSGIAQYAVLANLVSGGGSASAVTLFSQSQSSVQWAAGSPDKYLETKTTFPTLTPAGNDQMVVALKVLVSGWSVAQVVTIIPSLIWE